MNAFIIVDCQNDFSENGSLPVNGANLLAKNIYLSICNIDRDLNKIIFSIDKHPINHISFNEWPAHCIDGTFGCELIDPIKNLTPDLLVAKGELQDKDSYSIFNNQYETSELISFLKSNNITRVYVCGLVKDICVVETANDFIKFGIETFIIQDLTIALDENRYSKIKHPLIKECNFSDIEL
ncbi:MAG: isochorismatase family protein [Mycoplasma sp.]